MKIDHDELAAQQRTENNTKKWFIRGMRLLKQHPIQPTRIADFGAGKGEFLELLRIEFPESELYGFDYSNTNIATLEEKTFHAIRLDFDQINDDVYKKKEYLKGTFDVIASFAVIEHVFDTNSFLRLANFLLKEDGLLILSTPNLDAYQMKFFYVVNGFPFGEGHHVRFFTFKRLYSFAFLNGFKLEKEGSYFYYGIAPIQKAFTFLNKYFAAVLSCILFVPAFLLEKIKLWPRATKGDLLLLFKKNNLVPLGLGKQIIEDSWNSLPEEEKNKWKDIVKHSSIKKNLRNSPDTYKTAQKLGLWN